ncbi:MAG: hypothetical protein GY868_16120, partial [Deltaproteobacteria bacterium]|nr:hypothetical protein [Deltaproteobacteria bacterium]
MKKKRMNGLILAAAAFMLLFMYGCSMSSSGNPGDEDEIPLAAGQFTMNTSGGDGSDGYGGNGNGLQIVIGGPGYGGSGGDIKVLDTGVADAGFSFPSSVTTYLGDNPLTVTADTIVAVEAAEPAAGTPYMVNEEYRLFISDGDAVLGNAEEEVTGVSV